MLYIGKAKLVRHSGGILSPNFKGDHSEACAYLGVVIQNCMPNLGGSIWEHNLGGNYCLARLQARCYTNMSAQ